MGEEGRYSLDDSLTVNGERSGKREGLSEREGEKGHWGGNGKRKRMNGEGAKEGPIVVKSRRL